jgi:hypothetical protein
MRGESDYDEFDELAGMDVDLLQELGLVMAPMTAAPTTTSRCPTDERYDEIEQMCVPVQTSTGTSITRLRAQLQTTAPTMVMAPTVSPTTSKCPPGEEWDRIEGNCRVLPTDPAPTSPTRQLYTKYRAIAPTSVTVAPVKPRDAPVSSSAHPPPDAVRAADVLIKAPAPPKLPSYSSPFKGGRAAAVSVDHRAAPKPVSAQMLQMPVAPPAGGKVVGLSTGAKIGIGIGAGALLLYIMTRK